MSYLEAAEFPDVAPALLQFDLQNFVLSHVDSMRPTAHALDLPIITSDALEAYGNAYDILRDHRSFVTLIRHCIEAKRVEGDGNQALATKIASIAIQEPASGDVGEQVDKLIDRFGDSAHAYARLFGKITEGGGPRQQAPRTTHPARPGAGVTAPSTPRVYRNRRTSTNPLRAFMPPARGDPNSEADEVLSVVGPNSKVCNDTHRLHEPVTQLSLMRRTSISVSRRTVEYMGQLDIVHKEHRDEFDAAIRDMIFYQRTAQLLIEGGSELSPQLNQFSDSCYAAILNLCDTRIQMQARKYGVRTETELEELVGVVRQGFMDAINRFDFTFASPFIAFAIRTATEP